MTPADNSGSSQIRGSGHVEGTASVNTRVKRKEDSGRRQQRKRRTRKDNIEQMLQEEQEHIQQSPDDHIDFRA